MRGVKLERGGLVNVPFLEKGRKKSWWSHLSSVSPDMHCHRQSTTKPSMVGNASGYWARRKAESKHLTVGDRQDIVTAYRRTGTVRGAAKQGRVKVDPKTALKVIRQWHHDFFLKKGTLTNPPLSNLTPRKPHRPPPSYNN